MRLLYTFLPVIALVVSACSSPRSLHSAEDRPSLDEGPYASPTPTVRTSPSPIASPIASPSATPIPVPSATPPGEYAPDGTRLVINPPAHGFSGCDTPVLGEDFDGDCFGPSARYLGIINGVISWVVQNRRDLFDFNDEPWGGVYKILDRTGYDRAIMDRLKDVGYCSGTEGDEIQVSTPGSNYLENFDASTAAGYIRRAYTSACFWRSL